MTTSTAPSPFSLTNPNLQLTWDSTSLGWFKECPRLYYYQMILGWSAKSKGIHLKFGGLYAAALERYAHAKAGGASHDEATDKMVEWALEASGDRTVCPSCNGAPDEALPCGTCNDAKVVFHPWESNDPFKNRYTLIRSLVWNVDDRLATPFRTYILANGKPAVELSFNFEAFQIQGQTFSLAGHMDEVVQTPDELLYVRDDKTTKGQLSDQYFRQYSPNNQMSLYSIAGKVVLERPVAGVLVRAAQIQAGFTRFVTRPVTRPQPVLDEWMRDTEQWLKLAMVYADSNHYPMNDKSCGNYGGCPFQRVCAVSPQHRQSWLEADFIQRRWNPLETRGDI